MSESSLRVIVLPSLVYPYFEVDNKQDEIRKALLIKQETEWIEWFCSLLVILKSGAFITEGHLIQF